MTIKAVRSSLYDIPPQVRRTDAIQTFESMEFPLVEIEDEDGRIGVGFSYTIGKGGVAIKQIIDQYLIPIILDADPNNIDRIWQRMWMDTHWVGRGGIVGLGIAAIDIALWDLQAKRADLPLYQLLGGAKSRVPVYNTDGGWLHLTENELVRQSVEFIEQGFKGVKIKVGRDNLYEDVSRLRSVRSAIGQAPFLMIDANIKWIMGNVLNTSSNIEISARLASEINLVIFLFNFSYKVNYFRDKFVGIKYRIAMALTFSKEQLIWHAKLV